MQEMPPLLESKVSEEVRPSRQTNNADGDNYALLNEAGPRILLEVLSPSGTRLVLLFVYVSFGLAILVNRLNHLTVSSHAQSPVIAEFKNESVYWSGYVKGLGELFGSVSLDAKFPNGTNSSADTNKEDEDQQVGYDLQIWASKRKRPPHSTSYTGWHEVLRERHDVTNIHSEILNPIGDNEEIRSASLASWYQNQESPPSRSRIHSYLVKARFCLDDSDNKCPNLSPGLRRALINGDGAFSINYDDLSRSNTLGAKLARFALVIAWFAIAAAWLPHAIFVLRASRVHTTSMQADDTISMIERMALQNDADLVRRLMILVFGLLFYIDPIDCIVQFLSHNIDIPPIVAFLSFVSRRVGEAGILAALLLAADGDGAAAERLRKRFGGIRDDHAVIDEVPEGRERLLQSLVRAAAVRFSQLSGNDNNNEDAISFEDDSSILLRQSTTAAVVRRHWWLIFPLLYLILSICSLSLRFPSLFSIERAPTLALSSWPTSALRMYVGFSLGLVFAAIAWIVCLICLLYRTGSRLEKAPYVLTRRHQLSYRFFVLQATLVAVVASASYAALMIKLIAKYHSSIATALAEHSNGKQHALEELSSALEALVADDVRDLASAFFFLCYLGLLLYLNLPPPKTTLDRVLDGEAKELRVAQNVEAALERFLPKAAFHALGRASAGLVAASDLSSNFVHGGFVLTERADEKRRRSWRSSIRNLESAHPDLTLPQQLRMPPQVFVLETARWLVRVSAAVYFDCRVRTNNDDTIPMTGGSSGEADPRLLGLEPITELHVPDTDTYALVSRHVHKPWLVIAFRGSASTKHWSSNIDIRQYRLALRNDRPVCYNDLFGTADSVHMHTEERSQEYNAENDDFIDALPRQEEEEFYRGRAFVDIVMRCFALVVKIIERIMGFILSTTEAAGRATGAAELPGLDKLILPLVHRGFWFSYVGVRDDLHRIILQTCLHDGIEGGRKIERILITGHSLGGAQATLASADLAAHALPYLNSNIRLTLVTFGAPRVGNRVWARTHAILCPDSWRVVNDGDIVTGLPRFFFKHSGIPVVVDGRTGNFLVVNPSFVEQRLRLAARRKVSSHFLESYVRGLYGAAGLENPSSAELCLFAAQQKTANDSSSQHAETSTNFSQRIRSFFSSTPQVGREEAMPSSSSEARISHSTATTSLEEPLLISSSSSML
uniref:Fungal lipase-type domain-containing protein n=1 Tax=Aureoumbra lagunensis TaxID=44058 RepID=A0A7S3NM01_9STRA|mmetsp:Transcript_12708/g.19067  ORF Transcript_12708/g.19067 Transcript_12708/m.19067 type:complete len:1181 (-) Transcript_12708:73-3615(-)